MPLAPGLTVSAHLEACSVCRCEVSLYETIGEHLIAALPEAPLEPGALGRAVLSVGEVDTSYKEPGPQLTVAALPLPRALSEAGLSSRRWLAPGMWVARAKADEVDGWRTFLIGLPAGGSIPTHCHGGGELICVLKGSYSDGVDSFGEGDFAQADSSVEHGITVSPDGPCICLLSTQAPIQWRGWARLLKPILGL